MESSGAWLITARAAHTVFGVGWDATWSGLINAEYPKLSCYRGLGAMRPLEVVEAMAPVSMDGHSQYQRSRVTCLAVSALHQLLQDTGPNNDLFYLATNHGESDTLVRLAEDLYRRGNVSTDLIIEIVEGGLVGGVGPVPEGSTIVNAACASGLVALIIGALRGRREDKTVSVVAADALSDIECIGFDCARAISPSRCQPFSDQSDGLTIGEGSAAMRVHWCPRPVTCRKTPAILGFGLSCDSHHPTSPDPNGIEIERAWRVALDAANLDPEDVAGAILHGTGTPSNDEVEAKVYHRIWRDFRPPVSSIKSYLGHTMGASGLLSVLAATSALEHRILPPTLAVDNLTDLRVPVAVGQPVPLPFEGSILVAASGFGGQNAAVIVGYPNQ